MLGNTTMAAVIQTARTSIRLAASVQPATSRRPPRQAPIVKTYHDRSTGRLAAFPKTSKKQAAKSADAPIARGTKAIVLWTWETGTRSKRCSPAGQVPRTPQPVTERPGGD